MDYKISRRELSNDLLYDTLRTLARSLSSLSIPVYVVGATARDMALFLLHEDEPKRRTRDLDVAIAIPNWEAFDEVSEKLQHNGFEKLPAKQRFVYKGRNYENDYEVDIVPFGGVEENEQIKWQPEGVPIMSVKCFKDVLSHAVEVNIDDSLSVYMAPLCGQFLIKLDAWIDRHDRVDKDASDMVYILSKYFYTMFLSTSEVPKEVDVEHDTTADYLIAGAQWIAADLKEILSTDHLRYYIDFIGKEMQQDTESKLIGQFVHFLGDETDDIIETVKTIWKSMQRVFEQELNRRKDDNT
jgi:predicted nucleotidyltransferase